MALRIYNTLTRKKELFEPLVPGKVGMYACGVTVYDICHIGHARQALIFDVIRRYLEYKGYQVTYVRNFTDIDDKILVRARELGISWDQVAKRNIEAYYQDMDRLEIRRATIEPRATEHIPEMIWIIEGLLQKGYAYQVNGDIYFEVKRFPDYGKLSHRDPDEMLAGARVEVDPRKRDPLDFALWKASKKGEPAWESPWGPGRPGWHIECSAMSMKYLGESFDIHGGGEDLIFPHHENEIAQSEALTGKPFARYWIHNGFVKIRQEKMSKSLGNVFTIRELLDRYSPGALKLFLLSTHYRSPVDFTEEKLEEAEKAAERIQTLLRRIADLEAVAKVWPSPSPMGEVEGFRRLFEAKQTAFEEAMDDDFNTAQALGVLFEVVEVLNRLCDRLISRGIGVASEDLSLLRQGKALVHRVGDVFGLSFKASPNESFYSSISGIAEVDQALESSKRAILTKRFEEAVEIIGGLLKRREQVRAAGLYEEADRIRRELEAMGIKVDDTRFFTAVTTPFPSGPQGSLYVTLIKDENFSPSSAKDG